MIFIFGVPTYENSIILLWSISSTAFYFSSNKSSITIDHMLEFSVYGIDFFLFHLYNFFKRTFCLLLAGDWHFLNVCNIEIKSILIGDQVLSEIIAHDLANAQFNDFSPAEQLSEVRNWKIIFWRMIKKPLSSSRGETMLCFFRAISFHLSSRVVWQSDDGNEWAKNCFESTRAKLFRGSPLKYF